MKTKILTLAQLDILCDLLTGGKYKPGRRDVRRKLKERGLIREYELFHWEITKAGRDALDAEVSQEP